MSSTDSQVSAATAGMDKYRSCVLSILTCSQCLSHLTLDGVMRSTGSLSREK
jgi:hypothetical protein